MAKEARNATELEADRLFILRLRRDGGLEMKKVSKVMSLLNDRRVTAARDFALAMGKSKEEANKAGVGAKLSLQTVRRDIQVVDDRLKVGANSASAVWLDEQVDQVEKEYQQTFQHDKRVWAEIERSRTDSWTETRSVVDDKGKETGTTEKVTRRRNNGSAPASLYNVIQRNVTLRMHLRAELLRLRYGSMWFASRREASSFSESLVDMGDPGKSREAAIAIYQREVEAMVRSEQLEIGPLPPEFVAAERARQKQLADRTHAVKALIAAGKPSTLPNQPQREPYQLVVTRVTSGNGHSEEGDDE